MALKCAATVVTSSSQVVYVYSLLKLNNSTSFSRNVNAIMTAGIQLLEGARQNIAQQIVIVLYKVVNHVGIHVPEPAISAMKF